MTKSKWPRINTKGTVLIKLALESFHLSEAPVLIDKLYYTPKDELHVTLVGEKVCTILQNKIKQDPAVIEVLEHVFVDTDWSFYRSGPIHILSRHYKNKLQKTVIMLIDMPGVAEFYQQLKSSGLIPENTPIPPAHVTLYTHNCPLGIGVPSEEILNSLSEYTLSVEEFDERLTKTGQLY